MLPLASVLLALHLTSPPFLGLACGDGGGGCDRIGVAVWLPRPAQRVVVFVRGRPVVLATGPHGRGRYAPGRFWHGFFRNASVARIAEGGGRVIVRVRATFSGGRAGTAAAVVAVSQGYG